MVHSIGGDEKPFILIKRNNVIDQMTLINANKMTKKKETLSPLLSLLKMHEKNDILTNLVNTHF